MKSVTYSYTFARTCAAFQYDTGVAKLMQNQAWACKTIDRYSSLEVLSPHIVKIDHLLVHLLAQQNFV